MPPCGKNMCGYSRPWDIPGIRKGLKVRWLPVLVPRCAELRWALLVEVTMAVASTPLGLLLVSAAPFSSRLLSFSPTAAEGAVLSLSAGVVDEGLAASDAEGAVVVMTFTAESEEEEPDPEEEELG